MLSEPTADENGIVWGWCEECGRPIFRYYAWAHEGGTPPQDHEAEPAHIDGSPCPIVGPHSCDRAEYIDGDAS